MQIDIQEQAADTLMSNVGKYISIYHKYNKNREDDSCTQDICVAKVVSVTKAQFLSLPRLKLQFNNGKMAEFSYSVGYGGQLMIHWDYNRTGKYFNDMFVSFVNNEWQYTYPEDKKASVDYFLTNGDLFVKFYETSDEMMATIEFYNEKLQFASVKREQDRMIPGTAVEKKVETIKIAELDRVFLAGA